MKLYMHGAIFNRLVCRDLDPCGLQHTICLAQLLDVLIREHKCAGIMMGGEDQFTLLSSSFYLDGQLDFWEIT